MHLRGSILAVAVALAALSGSQAASAQGVFTLSSPDFKDGERLTLKNAGNNKANPNCVGENVSPALSWANPPAGTKSYALLMFDPEGRPPGGVSHWVAYGIPVSLRARSPSPAKNMSAVPAPTSSPSIPARARRRVRRIITLSR